MRIYKYLFYKFYYLYSKGGTDLTKNAETTAWGIVSMLPLLNIYTIYQIGRVYFGYENGLNKPMGIIIVLISYLINYFIFLRNDRYLEVSEEYSSESTSEKNQGTILVLLYTAISLIALLYYM
jgi:hypothetical protein